MPCQKIKVINEVGLHARPASVFVKDASQFECKIQVRNLSAGSDWVDAKSILSVLTLGVERGHEIEICTQGGDEDAALNTLISLIESDFAGRL